MTGMRFIGPGPRAVALRSAANRLRWEVDVALGVASGCTQPRRPWEAGSVLMLHDLAEAAAILRRVLDTIDDNAQTAGLDRGWVRERFRADLAHHYVRHEVGR